MNRVPVRRNAALPVLAIAMLATPAAIHKEIKIWRSRRYRVSADLKPLWQFGSWDSSACRSCGRNRPTQDSARRIGSDRDAVHRQFVAFIDAIADAEG